jgi:hypothetical protein
MFDRVIKEGDTGKDVGALQYLLAKNRHDKNFKPGKIDRVAGDRTMDAVLRCKWWLGYSTDWCRRDAGPTLLGFLVERGHPLFHVRSDAMLERAENRKGKPNPFAETNYPEIPWPFKERTIGKQVGWPMQGTHTRGNWESDYAVDLRVPEGTQVTAVSDGQIVGGYGAIDSDEAVLEGLRFHLQAPGNTNEWYYAHNSKILVPHGAQVKRGQVLALSGSANTVPHLHLGQRDGHIMTFLGLS